MQTLNSQLLCIMPCIVKPGFCQKAAFYIRAQPFHPHNTIMIKRRNNDPILHLKLLNQVPYLLLNPFIFEDTGLELNICHQL